VILHWSNLAFDREITIKRTKKVSSIISSKKILSQVTVSLKNGQKKSPNCPKCNYFSQHCQWVIRKRECPLCWCTERREVFNPHVRKQHSSSTGGLPHMKREVPMHSLLMCYACAISKPKHQLLLFEKDRYSNVEGRCNSKTLRCLSEIVAVTLTGSKKFLQSANKRHCPSRPMKKVEVVATGRKQIG